MLELTLETLKDFQFAILALETILFLGMIFFAISMTARLRDIEANVTYIADSIEAQQVAPVEVIAKSDLGNDAEPADEPESDEDVDETDAAEKLIILAADTRKILDNALQDIDKTLEDSNNDADSTMEDVEIEEIPVEEAVPVTDIVPIEEVIVEPTEPAETEPTAKTVETEPSDTPAEATEEKAKTAKKKKPVVEDKRVAKANGRNN